MNDIWLQVSGEEIHSSAIGFLAQLTASAIEFFHKSGELLLLAAESADGGVDVDKAASGLIR